MRSNRDQKIIIVTVENILFHINDSNDLAPISTQSALNLLNFCKTNGHLLILKSRILHENIIRSALERLTSLTDIDLQIFDVRYGQAKIIAAIGKITDKYQNKQQIFWVDNSHVWIQYAFEAGYVPLFSPYYSEAESSDKFHMTPTDCLDCLSALSQKCTPDLRKFSTHVMLDSSAFHKCTDKVERTNRLNSLYAETRRSVLTDLNCELTSETIAHFEKEFQTTDKPVLKRQLELRVCNLLAIIYAANNFTDLQKCYALICREEKILKMDVVNNKLACFFYQSKHWKVVINALQTKADSIAKAELKSVKTIEKLNSHFLHKKEFYLNLFSLPTNKVALFSYNNFVSAYLERLEKVQAQIPVIINQHKSTCN